MAEDPLSNQSNLWLADTLWRLGAVQFGDFTLGRTTVHSPVYVNLRLLVGKRTPLVALGAVALASNLVVIVLTRSRIAIGVAFLVVLFACLG